MASGETHDLSNLAEKTERPENLHENLAAYEKPTNASEERPENLPENLAAKLASKSGETNDSLNLTEKK